MIDHSRRPGRWRRRVAAVWIVAIGLTCMGCLDTWRRPTKAPVSGLWLVPEGDAPEASQIARLADQGVRELYVVAGVLKGESGEIERLTLPELPPSTTASLVVVGDWPTNIADTKAFAERFAAGARQLRFDAESRGLVPVGIHVDATGVADLETYASALREVRKGLDRSLFLGSSVRRPWLQDDDLGKVVKAVDLVVAFLYGQLPREAEDPSAWDFVLLERGLQRLEDLGARTLLGVITLGTATHRARSGAVRDRTTNAALPDLLWNRRLKLQPGFTLEGVNRQVYTVVAEKPATVGSWRLETGDEVRVVRPVTSHIEELVRLRGAWNLPNLLGFVFYRTPQVDERLSLKVDNLLVGLDPAPQTPSFRLEANLQRGTGRGWLFRATVHNESSEVTELSTIDRNWLEVATDRGTVGRVQVGDFYRFVLYRRERDGTLAQTFRRADTVRLFLPLLEGGQSLTTGDIEVLSPGREPALTLRAGFLLTDGRTVEVGPVTWRRGRLVDP